MDTQSQDILKLERAATIVLSPPNTVSKEKRSEAEATFLELRQLSQPYQLCQVILESTCSDFLYFQALTIFKEAILREWPVLSSATKSKLRQYLLQYIFTKKGLPAYIQQHLFTLISVISKRAMLDPDGKEMIEALIDHLSQLAFQDTHIQDVCSLLSTLLSEFSSSSGSSSLGLPYLLHSKCTHEFVSTNAIMKIFNMAIQTLQEHYLNPNSGIIVNKLLEVSLSVLTWDFSDVAADRIQYIGSIVHDPIVIELLMKIFQQFSLPSEAFQNATQCLVSLSFPFQFKYASDKDLQQKYLSSFSKQLVILLGNCNLDLLHYVFSITKFINTLAKKYSKVHFMSLEKDILSSLLHCITSFIEVCCKGTLEYQSDGDNLSEVEEALCQLLEVFSRFVDEPKIDELTDILQLHCSQSILIYVQSKLTAPRGLKQSLVADEVHINFDVDDRVAFADELSYIGNIARICLSHTMPLLVTSVHQSLIECSQLLHMFLKDSSALLQYLHQLEHLYDDLHWLFLISTYVLTDVVQEETPSIPHEVMAHSITIQESYSTVFEVQDIVLNNYSDMALKIDPFVAIILSLYRWCVLEKGFIDAGLKDVVSPQLCETVVWSLETVLCPYLMMKEGNYPQLSMSFLSAFGQDTENAKWMLSFMLDKVILNISTWYTEERLAISTLKLISKLASTSSVKAAYLISCQQLWFLMKAFVNGEHPFTLLQPSIQKETAIGLLSCAVGAKSDQYVNEFLSPVKYRFDQIICGKDVHQDETLYQQLLCVLEVLCGIALTNLRSLASRMFTFLFPFLQTCIQIFKTFNKSQDISLCILELFIAVSENIIIFLEYSEIFCFYELSLALIQVYGTFFTEKYKDHLLTDDDKCDDIVSFIQLMCNLVCMYTDSELSDDSFPVSPGSIVIQGFTVILFIVDDELLKFPTLCEKFYQLIQYICDILGENCPSPSEDIFQRILNLLDSGCTKYSSDICSTCLECIKSLSSSYASVVIAPFQHFLKSLFEHTLTLNFNDDELLNSYSMVLYHLLCNLKNNYDQSIELLLMACRESAAKNYLYSVVCEIAPLSVLDGSHKSKDEFCKKYSAALPLLRGYLCIQ